MIDVITAYVYDVIANKNLEFIFQSQSTVQLPLTQLILRSSFN